uniref:Uncharacterized protein n=1 Tax=viral metagenome TaxID=1070528 RepID=A0A6C0DB40_9ZZZZ
MHKMPGTVTEGLKKITGSDPQSLNTVRIYYPRSIKKTKEEKEEEKEKEWNDILEEGTNKVEGDKPFFLPESSSFLSEKPLIIDDYYKKPKVKFSTNTIDNDLLCIPGPKAFNLSERAPLRHYDYLNNYDSNYNPQYGCNSGQYIKYEEGHYCCVNNDKKATPQEMLNYVNMLIESFIKNVGYSRAPNAMVNRIDKPRYKSFKKELFFLLHHRGKILEKNPRLVDNFEMPEEMPKPFSGLSERDKLTMWVSQFSMPEPVLVEGKPTDMNEDAVLQQMLLQQRGIADDKGNIIRKPFYHNLGGKKTRTKKSNKTKTKERKKIYRKNHKKTRKTNRYIF